jgi:hypothetical protein
LELPKDGTKIGGTVLNLSRIRVKLQVVSKCLCRGVTRKLIVTMSSMDEVPRDEGFSGMHAGKKFHEVQVLQVFLDF